MILAIGITAEYAKLKSLGTDFLGTGEDLFETLAREGAGHQPYRVVARLRLGLRQSRPARHSSDSGKRRCTLEEITPVHQTTTSHPLR